MFQKMQRHVAHKLNFFDLSHFFFTKQHYFNRTFGLILFGLASCLLPHPPNFTAMNAIALFGIPFLQSFRASFTAVFSIILINHFIFGFHSTMSFVYICFGLIILMGYGLKSKRSLHSIFFSLVLSSFLFYVISNFGVWLIASIYPKTLLGLELCYVAALPFLLNSLISTIFYGALLFGWLAWSEKKVQSGNKLKAMTL